MLTAHRRATTYNVIPQLVLELTPADNQFVGCTNEGKFELLVGCSLKPSSPSSVATAPHDCLTVDENKEVSEFLRMCNLADGGVKVVEHEQHFGRLRRQWQCGGACGGACGPAVINSQILRLCSENHMGKLYPFLALKVPLVELHFKRA